MENESYIQCQFHGETFNVSKDGTLTKDMDNTAFFTHYFATWLARGFNSVHSSEQYTAIKYSREIQRLKPARFVITSRGNKMSCENPVAFDDADHIEMVEQIGRVLSNQSGSAVWKVYFTNDCIYFQTALKYLSDLKVFAPRRI